MKAVIYARYSSDSQREESIDGQIRECTAFAEKNGITILRHYIDRAYSAKTDNRPDFQEMIKDSGKKLFDMVIVWKLDRFASINSLCLRYFPVLPSLSETGVEPPDLCGGKGGKRFIQSRQQKFLVLVR